jgi:hypothetical protein
MGCMASYPLPAGKLQLDDHDIPKQIDVKLSDSFGHAEGNVEGRKTPTKQLSPLRNAINAEEIARPQSEERKVLRERLTTGLMSSINTELSVIKEDEVEQLDI